MKITFNIQYGTYAGEELRVNVLQDDGSYNQFPMKSPDGSNWSVLADVKASKNGCVEYVYSVHRLQTELRREWQMMTHKLEIIGQSHDSYNVFDMWYDFPEDSYLYSTAFTKCIHRREHQMSVRQNCKKTLRIKVRAPQLRQGDQLCLLGSVQQFGLWDGNKAINLCEHDNNEWVCTVDVADIMGQTVWFKFVIKDANNGITWETGEDRQLVIPEIGTHEVVVMELRPANFPINDQKFAGTAIPIFSLRSKGSFGVGDFGDLKLMIDWVAKTGQRILQVLPINDTTLTHTWTDSYPYSCVSIYALHPLYCDIRQLPPIKDKEKATEMDMKRISLNAQSQVDYEKVTAAKNEILHIAFEAEGKDVFATPEFKEWFAEEEEWLVPYAQYSVLRDKYGTPDYTQWPDHNTWAETDRKSLTSARTKAYREASFYYYVQYILAKQMKEAHEYARHAGVVLKGDIPIGVNRNSCDAWMEPRYFNLNGQAGAPPDEFSTNGQNWGFPTYNWEEMLNDDCRWWVRRFSNMAKYFDAYRIDHVLGFFRIWEIPQHSVHGLLGQFQPALGMTVSEILQYGMYWNEKEYLEPYITGEVINTWFGDRAEYARETFFEPADSDGRYSLKEEFRTQRQVEKYFEHNFDIASVHTRDTLYALISNVLFLRDHKNPDLYHPRISAQYDPCYEHLDYKQKEAFNNLYNDYYYRRNDHFWYLEAMKKLPRLVNATRMLVCAEDLGMVPGCVASVMNNLRILSLEIQSMPKETGLRFGKLHHNPYRSVCTISSHDTPTLRMWWDEDNERTQDYYRTRLRRGNEAPHPLPSWLAREILYRNLACPSMLCILTLQDWLAMDENIRLADAGAERINIPANPKHYWRYRMHLNLEELIESDDFNYSVIELLKETGRKL